MSARSSIFTITNFESYRERVRQASLKMELIGWGSRGQCATDLSVQPVAVSNLLNGVTVNEELLLEVENWLSPPSQHRVQEQVPEVVTG